MQDAFEVRVTHANAVHVVERVADVVDAWPADADALRHQPRASVQVELAHIGRMGGIGDKRERAHGLAGQFYPDQPRLVDPARHLAVPEPRERAAHPGSVDAVRHAPTGAAAAQAHDQSGLALRAAIARRQDAQRAVIAMRPAERLVPEVEARRPHQRAIAEHPEIALGQPRAEFIELHRVQL